MNTFERMDHAQLIQGFSDQTKVVDAHSVGLVVVLTPFLTLKLSGGDSLNPPPSFFPV